MNMIDMKYDLINYSSGDEPFCRISRQASNPLSISDLKAGRDDEGRLQRQRPHGLHLSRLSYIDDSDVEGETDDVTDVKDPDMRATEADGKVVRGQLVLTPPTEHGRPISNSSNASCLDQCVGFPDEDDGQAPPVQVVNNDIGGIREERQPFLATDNVRRLVSVGQLPGSPSNDANKAVSAGGGGKKAGDSWWRLHLNKWKGRNHRPLGKYQNYIFFLLI